MLHGAPRRAAAALVALLIIAAGPAAHLARATDDFALGRVAGQDRYATAAEIAQLAFPEGSANVVLARGDAFPDALAGTYLTGVLSAPILLTMTNDLPDVTEAAIETLGAETVYLLGGTGAISTAVEEELAADHEVVRLGGDDRYETAYEITHFQETPAVGELDGKATAIVASGAGFADALAAGPIAHAAGLPILLAAGGSLPAPTGEALDHLGIEHVVIAGGTAAVSDGVADEIEGKGITVERVAGLNRYATAAELADFALDTIPGWDNEAVDLATGEKFADALAAGPAAGEDSRSILLTAGGALSPETAGWLSSHSGTLLEGRVYGGTAAVTNAVVDAAEAAGQGATGGPQSGQLTFVDEGANMYRFVPTGADEGVEVTYDADDTFLIDGAPATIGGFEDNATPADEIRHVPAAGSAQPRHELTNVDASTITSGTVGNVDLEDTELDIINAVTGDALRSNISWEGQTYTVDGATANLASFEDDLNEGDTIAITIEGATTTFELTNVAVTGAAANITSGPLPPATTFQIGELGDIPDASSDGGADPEGNDDVFEADGNPVDSTDTYTVEGEEAEYADFEEAITPGDAITYTREGGAEHFELINTTPTTQEGQAVDDLAADADGDMGLITPNDADGGAFTLATEDGALEVEYVPDGEFVVNGSIADEGEFEAAYTAGDEITFRPADDPSGTDQRLELTDATLEGVVANPATADDTYDVLADNGETVLATITYVGAEGANTYFINGASATLEAFEAELDAIAADEKTGTVQVIPSGDVTQHRLTTAAAA